MRAPFTLALSAALAAAAGAAPKAKPAAPAAKPTASSPAGGPDLPSTLPLTGPVAVVNGEAIPISLYVDRLSLRYGPDVRESLIQEVVVRQEAKRRGISASAAEIDGVVQRTYSETVRKVGDESKLADELKRTRGWTPSDFKAVIRREADVQVLRAKLAEALVKPTEVKDEEIEKRYSENREAFVQPDTVRISHILIRRPAGGDAQKEAAAKARAEELLKRVSDARGANFDALAKQMSEDAVTGPTGGKLPTDIVRGQHPFGAAFEATVFNAPAGLVEQVIATPMGYHVIRVDSKKAGRTLPLTEVKEQLRTSLLTERRDQKLDELFLKLRTTAKINTGKF